MRSRFVPGENGHHAHSRSRPVPACDWSGPRQVLTERQRLANLKAAIEADPREEWLRFARGVGVAVGAVLGALAALLLAVALLGPGGFGGGAPRSGGSASDPGPECSSRAGCGW